MDSKILKKESKTFFNELVIRKRCNIALTIQPNDKNISFEHIHYGMKLIEKRIKSIFFRNKELRNQFFYIATIEKNYLSGTHLHLIMTIPENIYEWFLKKYKDIIKKQFRKSSIFLEEIYKKEGWISYISKYLWQKECYENFMLSGK